jgi:hypothetical protein
MLETLLVRQYLFGVKLLNELLDLVESGEFECVFLSVKKDFALEKSPENLQDEFGGRMLLIDQYLLEREQELLSFLVFSHLILGLGMCENLLAVGKGYSILLIESVKSECALLSQSLGLLIVIKEI